MGGPALYFSLFADNLLMVAIGIMNGTGDMLGGPDRKDNM
jgi:hypothetical protein